jgi:hypothetical protein
MSTPKKGWFERNQGLITFSGYLTTVFIGGISLYFANSKSSAALEISRNQLKYEIRKDSLSKIDATNGEKQSEKRFVHQDSLNKHQNDINEQQLAYFKSQTQILKQQVGYFKKQTEVSESQLKNAELVYQRQQNVDRPIFAIQNFELDSIINKPRLSIKCLLINGGRRSATIKKETSFFWNTESNVGSFGLVPVGGSALAPTASHSLTLQVNQNISFNKNTLLLIQVFYTDENVKGIQEYSFFCRFDPFKPLTSVQINLETQTKFLKRIEDAEKFDRKNYLSFSK